MLKYVLHCLFLTASALLLVGCRISGLVAGAPQPNQVLFQDNFSNPLSGWTRFSDSGGDANYASGMYRILVNVPGLDLWAHPGLDFDDVRIEADAIKVGGQGDNRFGVICRLNGPPEQSNFYVLMISSDGYYGIGKVRGPDTSLLGAAAMLPSEAIHLGGDPNHIRADCVGNRLTLYVNGFKLAEVSDPEFRSGDVGLLAGAYQNPGVDIRFDNFSVLKP
jgi:hypothetical protein